MPEHAMREKELRLALVCYGGISLAVYMHGITKELWNLARASRAHFDNAADLPPVVQVYRDLIARVERTAGLRIRVLIDIVAGASAGGINGIFLAQAIATGQSLDPLTDLWLDAADVDRLIDPEARAQSRLAKIWATPIAWAFAGRQGKDWDDDLDPATRDEVHDKLTRFVRSRWFEPPFGGPGFCTLLLDAFAAMAALPAGPRLLPDEQPLDLFVTVTDFHGHVERLRLNSPPEILETEHRMTIGFRDAPGDPALLGSPEELVFAARATASFPGAFPPFTVGELDAVLSARDQPWADREAFLRRIFPQLPVPATREAKVLIDGSVLANAPFGPAIDALKDRPARREVDRRFVYIDPKPGIRSVSVHRRGENEVPGFFSTILGALSDLPREQPIRDNLDSIAHRSDRIRRMRAIIDTLRPAVEASVQTLFGRTLFLDRPTAARLGAWRLKADDRARRDAGHSYDAYTQLRAANLLAAARTESRIEIDDALVRDGVGVTLADRDLGFRIRRLRFLLRRLAALAQDVDDPGVDAARTDVYQALSPLLDMEIDPASATGLAARDGETDARVAIALGRLGKAARRPASLAYLGFPFYDVATYALLLGEGLDEFDEIKVDRISPEDAQSIRQGGAQATLKGVQFNSFGAFFSRAYRENDYLWGRLHGAERLIDVVLSTVPTGSGLEPHEILEIKRAAFDAILDEEALRCGSITRLVLELRQEVAAMGLATSDHPPVAQFPPSA